MLWVSKVYEFQNVAFKGSQNKTADLSLDISPIYYSIIDHKRDGKFCFVCIVMLPIIWGKAQNLTKTVPDLSVIECSTAQISR